MVLPRCLGKFDKSCMTKVSIKHTFEDGLTQLLRPLSTLMNDLLANVLLLVPQLQLMYVRPGQQRVRAETWS